MDLTSDPGETIESTFEFGPGVCLDISQTGAEVRCNLNCLFDCVYSKQRVRTGGKLDQVGSSWQGNGRFGPSSHISKAEAGLRALVAKQTGNV